MPCCLLKGPLLFWWWEIEFTTSYFLAVHKNSVMKIAVLYTSIHPDLVLALSCSISSSGNCSDPFRPLNLTYTYIVHEGTNLPHLYLLYWPKRSSELLKRWKERKKQIRLFKDTFPNITDNVHQSVACQLRKALLNVYFKFALNLLSQFSTWCRFTTEKNYTKLNVIVSCKRRVLTTIKICITFLLHARTEKCN